VEPQFIFVLLTEAAMLCVVAASIIHVGCWRVIHMRSFLQSPKQLRFSIIPNSERKGGKKIKTGTNFNHGHAYRHTQSLGKGSEINLSQFTFRYSFKSRELSEF
jgi:hypothetical protein